MKTSEIVGRFLATTTTEPGPSTGTGAATLSGSGVTTFLRDNAVPIILFFIAIVILIASRKKDLSSVGVMAVIACVGLGFVAIALNPLAGINTGRWFLGLFGISA